MEDVQDERTADVSQISQDTRAPAKIGVLQLQPIAQCQKHIPAAGVENPGANLFLPDPGALQQIADELLGVSGCKLRDLRCKDVPEPAVFPLEAQQVAGGWIEGGSTVFPFDAPRIIAWFSRKHGCTRGIAE